MKISTHVITQALLTVVQLGNMFSGAVPMKYVPFIALAITLAQAALAWLNHYYNPDGTPMSSSTGQSNGGNMKKLAIIGLVFLFASTLHAQTTPAPAPDILESAWNVAVNGSFASVSGVPTNNGFVSGVSIRIAQHWNLRSDVYQLASPQGMTLVLGGPEYRFSLAHLVKQTAFSANAAKVEGFINVGAGDAKTSMTTTGPAGSISASSTTTVSASKFAYSAGVGFDITLTNNITLRPLDVKYVRSSFLNHNGGFYGNQLDFAAGLGLRF